MSHPNDVVAKRILLNYGVMVPSYFICDLSRWLLVIKNNLDMSLTTLIQDALIKDDYDKLSMIISSVQMIDWCSECFQQNMRDVIEFLQVVAQHASPHAWNMLYSTEYIRDVFMFPVALNASLSSYIMQHMIQMQNLDLLLLFVERSKQDEAFYKMCIASFFEQGVHCMYCCRHVETIVRYLHPSRQIIQRCINKLLLDGHFDAAEVYIQYSKSHFSTKN
jgi:hypothetical protein